MAQESNNSVSYLLSLKESTSQAFGAAPGEADNAVQSTSIAAGTSYSANEKRRSPRYKCEGCAELREKGSEIELSLDVGEVQTDAGSAPLTEVELELKRGRPKRKAEETAAEEA